MTAPYRAVGDTVYHGDEWVATLDSAADANDVVARLNAVYAPESTR